MATLPEPLMRWCKSALESSQQDAGKRAAGPIKLSLEEAIEDAAWTKMLLVRGWLNNGTIAPINSRTRTKSDLRTALFQDCPLSELDPAETLGAIHEFLVARREAYVVRRRSVSQKVGGVFYTPQSVVDYLVSRTLASDDLQKRVETEGFVTILDPAAGCGAFLSTAFRRLIDCKAVRLDVPTDQVVCSQGVEKNSSLNAPEILLMLKRSLFGVDLDPGAIRTLRRVLVLILLQRSTGIAELFHGQPPPFQLDALNQLVDSLSSNFVTGDSLSGSAFTPSKRLSRAKGHLLHWGETFPQIAERGGFDIIVGNPPYRRERDFKSSLDWQIDPELSTFHTARMDLWYYFVHRGLQLLRSGGKLGFITNAYWFNGTGAEKLIQAMCDEAHLDELFWLRDQPVFAGVVGQHSIFILSKGIRDEPVDIRIAPRSDVTSLQWNLADTQRNRSFPKELAHVFREGRIDIWPEVDSLFARWQSFPRLHELGKIRQGIAENPAAVNLRTLQRFQHAPEAIDWKNGEGVFSLSHAEVKQLSLNRAEKKLLRPYHDLRDLNRYWHAETPSRFLIYSTKETCPYIQKFPNLLRHLQRFRPILEARRETSLGQNQWWHLHWPRDEAIWKSDKLIILQMAPRPSVVPAFQPAYVSFSANVFVPDACLKEDLRYLGAILNSRLIWGWLWRHAKHRGIGVELNGHVISDIPIRRINFDDRQDSAWHRKLVSLVDQRMACQRDIANLKGSPASKNLSRRCEHLEQSIDETVARLYQISSEEMQDVCGVLDEL